jgi:hypothetical protein
MTLAERAQAHPSVTGTICFLFLGGLLVGGINGYKKITHDRARRETGALIHGPSNQVYRLALALEKAKAQFKQSGPSLGAEERIKINSILVVVEDNLPVYYTVLSNAYASIERNNFGFFRSELDTAQRSNFLYALKRDGQFLEQAVQYCKTRQGLPPAPISRP